MKLRQLPMDQVQAHLDDELVPPSTPPVTMPSVPGSIIAPLQYSGPALPAGFVATDKQAIINAWCGAAFDYSAKRMYLAVPGGHQDWYPNESFELQVPSGPSKRLHAMTPCPPTIVGPETVYSDGKPASRHTYNGSCYINSLNRVYVMGGSVTGPTGNGDHYVGLLDPVTGLWTHKKSSPNTQSMGLTSIYHQSRDRVIYGYGTKDITEYNPHTDTHTRITPQLTNTNYDADHGSAVTLALDESTNYLYAFKIGGFVFTNRTVSLVRLKLFSGSGAWEELDVTGDLSTLRSMNPGAEIDGNRMVLFGLNDPASLTVVDLTTLFAKKVPIPAVDVSKTGNGIFNRFRRYAPDKYCVLTDVTKPLVLIDLVDQPVPVPVDCVMSAWSAWAPTGDWSPCVAGSQSRTEQRTRTIITPPSNGGVACGPTSETRTVTQACTVTPPNPLLVEAHGNAYTHASYWDSIDYLDITKAPKEADAIPWDTFMPGATDNRIANSAKGKRVPFRQLPVYGPMNSLTWTIPAFVQVGTTTVQTHLASNFGADPMLNIRPGLLNWRSAWSKAPPGPYPARPGPRGHSIISPFITVYGHSRRKEDGTLSMLPHAPMWVSVRTDGLLQTWERDGSVHDIMALPIPANSYVNDMALPVEVANSKLLYYIDSVNGKIYHVDRATTPATITEFASGFGTLTSIKLTRGKLYVCERSSGNVIEIDVATKTRRTICNIPMCYWVDYTSTGKLAVASEDGEIFRVDPVTNTVQKSAVPSQGGPAKFVQIAVDRWGHCGEVDTVYLVMFTGWQNHQMVRLFPDGTWKSGIDSGNNYFSLGPAGGLWEPFGHYLWIIAVHPDEGLLAVGGSSTPIFGILAAVCPEDTWPALHPADGIPSGTSLAYWGYGGPQPGIYPSFTSQMSAHGCSATGITGDYLVSLGWQGFKDWLLNGGIGQTKRVLTNRELWSLMSLPTYNSQQHVKQGRALIDSLKAFLGV